MVLGAPQLSPHFLIEVSRDSALDHLRVTVEARPGAGETAKAACKQLDRRMHAILGVSAEIKLVEAGALARSEGKAQRVIDHRR